MPPNPGAGAGAVKGHNRRRLLIYGGMAVAMLLIILFARRASASSGTTASPTTSSAIDPATGVPYADEAAGSSTDYGSGSDGVDYSGELSSIDTDIQTMAQAIQAMQAAAQNPGASTPGTTGTDPTDIIGAIGGMLSQIPGLQSPPPSQPGPGNTPVAAPATKPAVNNAGLLAPGVKSPGYQLVRPAGHSNAVWAGPNKPGSNYTGVGGGWWVKK